MRARLARLLLAVIMVVALALPLASPRASCSEVSGVEVWRGEHVLGEDVVVSDGGNLTVVDCLLTAAPNTTPTIRVERGGVLDFHNSTVTGVKVVVEPGGTLVAVDTSFQGCELTLLSSSAALRACAFKGCEVSCAISSPLIDSCAFTGSQVGVEVVGEGFPTIRRCTVYRCGVGVLVDEASYPLIAYCNVSFNEASGVVVKGLSRPSIINCTLVGNGASAICSYRSLPLVEGCQVSSSPIGVSASMSVVTLRGLRVEGCDEGVRLANSSRGVIELSSIEGCGIGLLACYSSSLVARSCTVESCRVCVESLNSTVMLAACLVRGYSEYGLTASLGGIITAKACVVKEGEGYQAAGVSDGRVVAHHCYWGSPEGPVSVLGDVAYAPWCEEEFTAPDTRPPVVEVVWPGEGVVLSGEARVRVRVVDDGLVERVEVKVGRAEANVTWPMGGVVELALDLSGLPDSKYLVEAVAVDAAGHRSTASVRVVVDNADPVVQVLSPRERAILSRYATLRVAASDGNLEEVMVYFNDTLVASWSEPGEHMFTVNTSELLDGVYLVRAVAVDAAGRRGESGVKVKVDNSPPRFIGVEWEPGEPGPAQPATVRAVVVDDVTVVRRVKLWYRTRGGDWVGVEMRLEHGEGELPTWIARIPGRPAGTHVEFYVEAVDVAGNRAVSETYSYTVSNPLLRQLLPALALVIGLLVVAALLLRRRGRGGGRRR